ncbi:MAG: ribonuclease R [Ectothiorhodospiraceae bacterium]|nr:ribonuclease R [Ectothiorhodospiraceae bacterium]
MAKTKKHIDPKTDPHLAREQKKYDRPVPSREFIMDFLKEQARPMTRDEVASAMGLSDEEALEGLRRRLIAMERDGQLVVNRRGGYVIVDQQELVRGRVIGHPEGYGWLAPDVGGDRIYLSPRDMRQVLHGDRAVVRLIGLDQQGKPEGKLVDVLSRENRTMMGRFFSESGVSFVTPQNRRMHQDIMIPEEHRGDAYDGQLVVVSIEQQPSRRNQPIGRIIQTLGENIAPGEEAQAAALTFGIPTEWPPEVLDEMRGVPETVPEKAKQGRTDLRGMPLVTIDGADAKDFDDAVFCEPKPSGWRLVVAIADVSHYVRPDTALDKEAQHRATSVYFPGSVVPMLPEALSNGLCSLRPREDRLCMVCDMLIGENGEIRRSRFYRAVMRSRARLIYDIVARVVVDQDAELRERYRDVVPHLDNLYKLYKVLKKARSKRGAIDFETTETQILFDASGGVEAIEPTVRNDAHKLIEECMLAANMATARYLRRHRVPSLFRNHEGPDGDRLDNLRDFLLGVGLKLGGGESPASKDYARLMEVVAKRPDRELIQTVMLRSLQQAVYHPENEGHFGLAMEEYAHFTSPIRRYPDLLVHRAIGHIADGGKAKDFYLSRDEMFSLGEHCSMAERRADEATRDAVMILKCRYIRDRLGEHFDGVIAGVTGFGLFVQLEDVYVEGLVHVTQLDSDFFHFDPISHQLTGERTGRVYRLTDRVRVQVDRVDPDERKIDLSMLGHIGDDGRLTPVVPASDGRKPAKRKGGKSPFARKAGKPAEPRGRRKGSRR